MVWMSFTSSIYRTHSYIPSSQRGLVNGGGVRGRKPTRMAKDGIELGKG